MRVYLDAGIFIDYLSSRGPMGGYLRTSNRNGRPPSKLSTDAEKCLELIEKRHEGMTSSLTFYEVEEAFYKELSRSISGVSHGKRFLIPTARSVVPQLFIASELHNVKVLEVTENTVRRQIETLSLQLNAIRAADALHVTLAVSNGVDIIITGDGGILELDKKIVNNQGRELRCLESNSAIELL
ncbi:type II toxin-antitoxin system VapC family toxin [Pseudomonadota bacterium]